MISARELDGKGEDYYKWKGDIEAPYLIDLLYGRLRIYQVPPEHRGHTAYIMAIRWARGADGNESDFTEKKLIEHLLLSDIMETYRAGDPRYNEIYALYDSYFYPNELNLHGVGLI